MVAASSLVVSSSASPPSPHTRSVNDFCPLCDQAIPHDRFDEITERIQIRERATADAIEARLRDQHNKETAAAVDAVRREASAELTREREGAAVRLAAACEEQQRQSQAEIARVKAEAAANEAAIREDAARSAHVSVSAQIAAMEAARNESETTLLKRIEEAEAAGEKARATEATLKAQLEQTQQTAAAALEREKAEATERERTARAEGSRATATALQDRVAAAESAKAEAEAKAAATEQAANAIKEGYEAQLEARVQEVRTAMEAAQTQAVNVAKSEAYEEKLKLSEKVTDLQRALERKTSDELGEGAEIDLVEVLKSEFPNDKIERVGRGRPGADIIHTVMHNDQQSGKIIYDSKDHSAWRNDFVAKLASDKITEKADHAILAVRKFPQGVRQLHVQDGVILANPARVLALVHVVREHIVRTHALRLSGEARAKKSTELYKFITSAQCGDLLKRIDDQAQDLLDIQLTEKRAHDNMWKRQAVLYRSIQKAQADLVNRIDIIIGTAEPGDKAINGE